MAQDKTDIYQKVADQLVEMMETMGTGWTKPWRDVNQPINLISGKAYRGLNVLFLMMAGHTNRTWGTYKQFNGNGYQVQKGEKGTTIPFYKPIKHTDTESVKDNNIPPLQT